MKSVNPRWLALQLLLQVIDKGRSLDQVIDSEWYRGQRADARDLAFCRELVSGLCRWYFVLLPIVRARLQKPLRRRDRDIEIILLLGLYQLIVLQTEAHAAVNETVDLAAQRNKRWARGLINAVLRGVARDAVTASDLDPRTAYPDWMRTRIESDWGELADGILRLATQRPALTLRVDTQRRSREQVLEDCRAQEIGASAHAIVDSAVLLEAGTDPTRVPGFADGIVSVQDASAQLAARLLDCSTSERVLDACAAPGGKTTHLLQRYPGIRLDALDQSAARLERVRQNLERCGLRARLITGDAADPASWAEADGYDAILADVPCSSSGVMRRHPDIGLLRREPDIMAMVEQQARILEALWGLLRPGGKMLYCTCSQFKDENENQITGFVDARSDCVVLDMQAEHWGLARSVGRQILADRDDMDGFYYALLGKPGRA